MADGKQYDLLVKNVRLVRPNVAPSEGIFAHFPKGENHGATTCTEETTFLFYWDGPPTLQIDE